MERLCQSNVAPTGLSLIAWRLIRTGYVQESVNFCFYQLIHLFNFEKVYALHQSLAKHQLGLRDENVLFELYAVAIKYFDLF